MKRSIAFAGALILLAGCARLGAPGAGASPSSPDVTGTWVLQQGHGPNGTITIPADMRISITFGDGQVGGQACNHYGGDYRLEGNALSLSALSMTEMACQEDIMSAEAAYHAALADVGAVSRNGDMLVLRGDRSELVYALQPPVPDAALQDTSWVLDSVIAGDAVASVQGDATLTLGADGTFTGSTGCRAFSGRYTISGDQVVATDLAAVGECSEDLAWQDGAVLEVLADGFTVQVDGNRLTLSDTRGHGLGYRAAD